MTTRWLTLERRRVFEIPNRITVELETVQLPDGRVVNDYAQVRMASFAVIYAQTTDDRVICLLQYKHGPRRVSLTLPAGHLEDGEDPLKAAQRELIEETGFRGEQYQLLGSFAVNGNQGCGTAHVVLANRCHQVATPVPNDLEEMEIEIVGVDRLRAALLGGEVAIVSHAAAMAIGLLARK